MRALLWQWEIEFLWLLTTFNGYTVSYARVKFQEMIVLKDNTSPKLKVDDEGQLLAHCTDNTLPLDKSYQHLCGITIQQNVKAKRVYSSINVINHIMSICRSCNLCKNNEIIDSIIESKIKRAWTDNTTKEIKTIQCKAKPQWSLIV